MKVLMVDDEYDEYVFKGKALINKYRLDLKFALGVARAEEYLRAERFDVVLLDRLMPDPDLNGLLSLTAGDNLLEKIVRKYPGTCVVMLTNNLDMDSSIQLTQAGAFKPMLKDIPTEELIEAIRYGMMHEQISRLYDTILSVSKNQILSTTTLYLGQILELVALPNLVKSSEDSFAARDRFSCRFADVSPGGQLRLADHKLYATEDSTEWFDIDGAILEALQTQEYFDFSRTPSNLQAIISDDSFTVGSQILVAVRRRTQPRRELAGLQDLIGVICVQSNRTGWFTLYDIKELLRVSQAIGLAYGVLEKREVSIARISNAVESEMLAEFSHRIRTPLMTAQLQVDMLLENPRVDSVMRGSLAKIRNAIGQLNQSTDMLARGNQLPSGPAEEMALDVVLTEAAGSYGEETRTWIRLIVSSNIPSIQGFPQDMYYAFTNLFDNAIESINRKLLKGEQFQPEILASISVNSQKSDIELIIADNGDGFSTDVELGDLFDRGVSTKVGVGGKAVGIGLWEVKRIIQLHDGTIDASQGPKVGAYFSILIPVRGS